MLKGSKLNTWNSQILLPVKPLQVALVVAYLFMAPFYFTSWLKLFRKDTDLSSNGKRVSMAILAISTILWPIIVPIAYLELLKQKNDEIDQSIDAKS